VCACVCVRVCVCACGVVRATSTATKCHPGGASGSKDGRRSKRLAAIAAGRHFEVFRRFSAARPATDRKARMKPCKTYAGVAVLRASVERRASLEPETQRNGQRRDPEDVRPSRRARPPTPATAISFTIFVTRPAGEVQLRNSDRQNIGEGHVFQARCSVQGGPELSGPFSLDAFGRCLQGFSGS
jgi:hypothetical protein